MGTQKVTHGDHPAKRPAKVRGRYTIRGKDEEAGEARRGHGSAVPLQQRAGIDCAEMGHSMLRPYVNVGIATRLMAHSQKWLGYLGFLFGIADAAFQGLQGEVGLLFVD